MSFTRQLASVFAVAMFSSAQADVINVGPGDSIQDAINAAMDGDEIVVAPGTYVETINFNGKAITVRSSDGAEVTIIDGTGFFHVVQCVSGEGLDTVLDGFTITGGHAQGPAGRNNTGGGMYNHTSSPTVTNCTFADNFANYSGGGLYSIFGSPTVTNCTFSGNTCNISGGGMFLESGSPTVNNCMFSGNAAGVFGGGMSTGGGSPTVTNCSFIGNSAVENGGGSPSLPFFRPRGSAGRCRRRTSQLRSGSSCRRPRRFLPSRAVGPGPRSVVR